MEAYLEMAYGLPPNMSGDTNHTDVNCTGGIGVFWIIFGDCIHPGQDIRLLISDIIGIMSIVCWLLVGIPQMYANCQDIVAVGSMSKFLLIFWLLGDTFNLIGAFLSNQLKTQIYIACWYVAADLILCTQYVLYRLQRIRHKKAALLAQRPQPGPMPALMCISGFLAVWAWTAPKGGRLADEAHSHFSRSLLWTEDPANDDTQQEKFFQGPGELIGYVIGCVSAVMYFFSRSLQIRKNYRRKTTEGMSRMMFVLTVLGNLTYGVSIIVHGPYWLNILKHMPWLLGSLGIIFMDIAILYQTYYYTGPRQRLAMEREVHAPLLRSQDGSEEEEGRSRYGAVN